MATTRRRRTRWWWLNQPTNQPSSSVVDWRRRRVCRLEVDGLPEPITTRSGDTDGLERRRWRLTPRVANSGTTVTAGGGGGGACCCWVIVSPSTPTLTLVDDDTNKVLLTTTGAPPNGLVLRPISGLAGWLEVVTEAAADAGVVVLLKIGHRLWSGDVPQVDDVGPRTRTVDPPPPPPPLPPPRVGGPLWTGLSRGDEDLAAAVTTTVVVGLTPTGWAIGDVAMLAVLTWRDDDGGIGPPPPAVLLLASDDMPEKRRLVDDKRPIESCRSFSLSRNAWLSSTVCQQKKKKQRLFKMRQNKNDFVILFIYFFFFKKRVSIIIWFLVVRLGGVWSIEWGDLTAVLSVRLMPGVAGRELSRSWRRDMRRNLVMSRPTELPPPPLAEPEPPVVDEPTPESRLPWSYDTQTQHDTHWTTKRQHTEQQQQQQQTTEIRNDSFTSIDPNSIQQWRERDMIERVSVLPFSWGMRRRQNRAFCEDRQDPTWWTMKKQLLSLSVRWWSTIGVVSMANCRTPCQPVIPAVHFRWCSSVIVKMIHRHHLFAKKRE